MCVSVFGSGSLVVALVEKKKRQLIWNDPGERKDRNWSFVWLDLALRVVWLERGCVEWRGDTAKATRRKSLQSTLC